VEFGQAVRQDRAHEEEQSTDNDRLDHESFVAQIAEVDCRIQRVE